MRISESWSYAADPERVWAMTTDQAFQDRKCEATGATSYESTVTLQGGGATIVAHRQMPTSYLPDQLKPFAGTSLVVVETQTWGAAAADGSREGTVEVSIKGAPVALSGTATMQPNGSSTMLAINGELKASIPLVGGRIEKAAAPAVISAIGIESEVGAVYLAG